MNDIKSLIHPNKHDFVDRSRSPISSHSKPPKIDNLNDMESSHYISRMLCLGIILLAGGLNPLKNDGVRQLG